MVDTRGLQVNLLSALASHTRPRRVSPTFHRNRRSLNMSIVTEPLSNDELNPLWQPLELRATTLPNRVMCSATTLQYGNDGLLGDRHEAFYRERALGGVGLLFTEQLTASPLSKTASPALSRPTTRTTSRGSQRSSAPSRNIRPRLFAQLVAGGGKGSSIVGLDDWGPVRAPSRVPSPGGEMPAAARAGRDRPARRRLRPFRPQPAGRRGSRHRGARRARMARRAVPQPVLQPPRRRVRGQRRGALPIRAGDRRGHPHRGGRRTPGRAGADLRRVHRPRRHHDRRDPRAARGSRRRRRSSTSSTSRSARRTPGT